MGELGIGILVAYHEGMLHADSREIFHGLKCHAVAQLALVGNNEYALEMAAPRTYCVKKFLQEFKFAPALHIVARKPSIYNSVTVQEQSVASVHKLLRNLKGISNGSLPWFAFRELGLGTHVVLRYAYVKERLT